jgi:hypothetical protein
MKTNFRNHLSLENFKLLANFKINNPEPAPTTKSEYNCPAKQAWRSRKHDLYTSLIGNAILSFIIELKNNNELKPFSNSEGYSIQFSDDWATLISEDKLNEYEYKWLMDRIDRVFAPLKHIIEFTCIHITPLDCTLILTEEQKYERLVSFINDGNFDWSEIDSDDVCDYTGIKMKTIFTNWIPTLGTVSRDEKLCFNPVPNIKADNSVRTIEIEFKTGNLLINDWFRIDGFDDIVETERLPSINSGFGIEANIRHYIKNYGFISCFVGNSSPEIFMSSDKNTLVFGHHDEEIELQNFNNIGSVCTDLWWASIIEEEVLLDIITKTQGDNAHALIREYADNLWTMNRVKIEPGIYTLYFYPRHQHFSSRIKETGIILGNITEPYFALIKKEK